MRKVRLFVFRILIDETILFPKKLSKKRKCLLFFVLFLFLFIENKIKNRPTEKRCCFSKTPKMSLQLAPKKRKLQREEGDDDLNEELVVARRFDFVDVFLQGEDDRIFRRRFRMSKSTFVALHNALCPELLPKRSTGMSSFTALGCTLRWLAGGQVLDISFLFGFSIQATYRAINHTINLIRTKRVGQHLFPTVGEYGESSEGSFKQGFNEPVLHSHQRGRENAKVEKAFLEMVDLLKEKNERVKDRKRKREELEKIAYLEEQTRNGPQAQGTLNHRVHSFFSKTLNHLLDQYDAPPLSPTTSPLFSSSPLSSPNSSDTSCVCS